MKTPVPVALDPAHRAMLADMLDEQHRFRTAQLRELRSTADETTGVYREVVATIQEGAEAALAEIEAAQLRMRDGGYGYCTHCGAPQSPERLEILPSVALCMTCQRG